MSKAVLDHMEALARDMRASRWKPKPAEVAPEPPPAPEPQTSPEDEEALLQHYESTLK